MRKQQESGDEKKEISELPGSGLSYSGCGFGTADAGRRKDYRR